VGFHTGYLQIIDLSLLQVVKTIEIMGNRTNLMTFSHDNSFAFYSKDDITLTEIKYKKFYESEKKINCYQNCFVFTKNSTELINEKIGATSLAKNDKKLIIGLKSSAKLMSIRNRKLIRKFDVTDTVKSINLVNNGKFAVMTEKNGNMHTMNLDTLQCLST